MSESVTEFTDKNGDLWIVRECEADDDCVAVKKWWPPASSPPDEISRAIDAMFPDEEEEDDDEAPRPGYRMAGDFHIPLASLGDLIEALRKFDRGAGRPA